MRITQNNGGELCLFLNTDVKNAEQNSSISQLTVTTRLYVKNANLKRLKNSYLRFLQVSMKKAAVHAVFQAVHHAVRQERADFTDTYTVKSSESSSFMSWSKEVLQEVAVIFL